MNFNIGGGQRGGYSNSQTATRRTVPDSPRKSKVTTESTFAKQIVKSMNVVSFNYSSFAYAFVQNAPGPVIRNFFSLFSAVCAVLIERVETDTSSDIAEYECGMQAARIRDALQKYSEEA